MKSKVLKKTLAALLAMVFILSMVPAMAFAKEEDAKSIGRADDRIIVAGDFTDFTKLIRKMLESTTLFRLQDGEDVDQDIDYTDTFQTGRVIVKPDKAMPDDVLDKAKLAIAYDDYIFLQFGNRKATKDACETLTDYYGEDRVFPDVVFHTQLEKATALPSTDLRYTDKQDPYLSWGVKNMGLDKMKNKLAKKTNKKTIKVAVIDTGINYLDELGQSSRIKDEFDTLTFVGKPQDFNGHGTFCAGVIAESTPSNVKVVPVKTITASGAGTSLHILMGVMYAAEIKADVVSMSLGGEDLTGIHYMDPFFKEIRENKGCIVVAAGNEQQDTKNCYPANSKYVITVGAIKNDNTVDKEYSNFGSHLDFVAPGTEVGGRYGLAGIPLYIELTGTSMATPHVAAACALVKTAHPEYGQKKVYNVLKANAVDIGAKGWDKYAGWGRINLANYAARL